MAYKPSLNTMSSRDNTTFYGLTDLARVSRLISLRTKGLYFLFRCPSTFYSYSISRLMNLDSSVIIWSFIYNLYQDALVRQWCIVGAVQSDKSVILNKGVLGGIKTIDIIIWNTKYWKCWSRGGIHSWIQWRVIPSPAPVLLFCPLTGSPDAKNYSPTQLLVVFCFTMPSIFPLRAIYRPGRRWHFPSGLVWCLPMLFWWAPRPGKEMCWDREEFQRWVSF